jgi:molecular chaperone DnaJ
VTKKIRVKIPPGVNSGMSLRVKGKGEQAPAGGPPGDLYVQIHVEEHEFFQRQEDDVVCRVPISFVDAALGTTVEIPTLDGPEELRIPEGTQPGDVLRLQGRGIPRLQGPGRGDQIVVVEVRIPTSLSMEQEELLRLFAGLEEKERRDAPPPWRLFKRRKGRDSLESNSMN